MAKTELSKSAAVEHDEEDLHSSTFHTQFISARPCSGWNADHEQKEERFIVKIWTFTFINCSFFSAAGLFDIDVLEIRTGFN